MSQLTTKANEGSGAVPGANRIANGTRVAFRRLDGAIVTDTVRGEVFEQEVLLAPYAPNETRPAVVLTEHSWCFVSDIIEARP